MITVILSYPNKQQAEVILAGVPRRGDFVRPQNGIADPALVVEYVLWMVGDARDPEPKCIVGVRPQPDGPVV